MTGATAVFEQAQAVATIDKQAGIDMLKKIVCFEDGDGQNDEQIHIKERSILELAHLYNRTNRATDLGNLIKSSARFLKLISKPKAARLVHTLVDLFLDMEANTGMELGICEECIEWAKQEKRLFLRQFLEARYVSLLCDAKRYAEALQLGTALLKLLKKIEDKSLLIEVHLVECKCYHALENLPKARAALTSARIIASSMYCPPKLQATLDLQSGILYAAIEQDFKIACSYFYEAFEGYNTASCSKAIVALKYTLLSKIMLKLPQEVDSMLLHKTTLKYAGVDVDAMKAIANATKKQSLSEFQQVLITYENELLQDSVIKMHLNNLYDTMLEQNLLRIIEPFSHVQIEHIAKVIHLSKNVVEKKLSMMILDKVFSGILDQENGVLIVLEDTTPCETYLAALESIHILGKVVDTLYKKTIKLS